MIRSHVLVCGGTGCTSSGSQKIRDRMEAELKARGLDEEIKVVKTGCFGLCALGPVMIVYPDGTFYSRVTEDDVPEIVKSICSRAALSPAWNTRKASMRRRRRSTLL